jgi:hypothetical protein
VEALVCEPVVAADVAREEVAGALAAVAAAAEAEAREAELRLEGLSVTGPNHGTVRGGNGHLRSGSLAVASDLVCDGRSVRRIWTIVEARKQVDILITHADPVVWFA